MNYILRVLRGASFKKLFTVIDRIHEKSGQNKFYTLLDIINCAIRYGAGYHDYLIFGFWAMNHKQRDSYLTRMRNKRLNTLLHDENYTYIFDKKQEFDKRFADYIGRDFRAVAELDFQGFAEFMSDKDVVFAKPTTGESGKGIERLPKDRFESLEQMFAYITDPAHRFGVIEQQLTQHPDLTAVYPHSINSYRIVTLLTDDGNVHCVYAVAKFGNAGKFVDNMENDGLCCPIDQTTGKIVGCAHTSALINYDAHPYTGVTLFSFKDLFNQLQQRSKPAICFNQRTNGRH